MKELHKKISNADTYLHMDHTSQRDKITEYPALLCSCLVEKRQQCSLSLLQTLICPGSNQVIERQVERQSESVRVRVRERPQVSLELPAPRPLVCLSLSLFASMSVSLFLPPPGPWSTHSHTYTHCVHWGTKVPMATEHLEAPWHYLCNVASQWALPPAQHAKKARR